MQPNRAIARPTLNGLNGPGRPTKRSKKLVTLLLDAISAGAPYSLACKAAVEQVAARGALKRLKKIEQHGEDNFAALSWMLERRYPEMFSKPEVQLNVGIQNNVNGNDKKNFEIVVVEDLEFMGLRQRSEYTHHPDSEGPVREVEATAVPAELSGHLSRENVAGGIVISRSEHEDNERRAARIEAVVDKLLGVAPESEDGGEQE